MSFALEFYSLSWDRFKSALTDRKPELVKAIKDGQWSQLLADDDLGEKPHHIFVHLYKDDGPWKNVDSVVAGALAEITDVMARPVSPNSIPPDISDNAALVVAALIRQFGTPTGIVKHDVPDQPESALRLNFRNIFLDGMVGTCFGDRTLGEKLAARPFFGLYHLDYLSWGGLTQEELKNVLAKFDPAAARSDDFAPIRADSNAWLKSLHEALKDTAAAGTDLVTLYRMDQEHYTSTDAMMKESINDNFPGTFGRIVKKLFT